uniref:Rab-GAP TBC domain-containing protein n=1 Tax=Macrostomum lignano TaxID=282301 RepID=A0A1I8F6W4_9PLAT
MPAHAAATASASSADATDEASSAAALLATFRRRKAERVREALSATSPAGSRMWTPSLPGHRALRPGVQRASRRLVWPLLTRVADKPEPPDADSETVVLDVERSLKRFPPGMDEQVRMSYQDQLVETIMRVLHANSHLHYYQGYHDIVITFLLVLDSRHAYNVVEAVSKSHLREHLYPSMAVTTELLKLDPRGKRIADLIEKHEVPPAFSVAWVITWFGHVLDDLDAILRLYDFFLASHPLMPLYFSAALVLHKQDRLLSLPPEDIDFAVLALLPGQHSNSGAIQLETVISEACRLFILHPPDTVQSPSWFDELKLFEQPGRQRKPRSRLGLLMVKAQVSLPHLLRSRGALLILLAVLGHLLSYSISGLDKCPSIQLLKSHKIILQAANPAAGSCGTLSLLISLSDGTVSVHNLDTLEGSQRAGQNPRRFPVRLLSPDPADPGGGSGRQSNLRLCVHVKQRLLLYHWPPGAWQFAELRQELALPAAARAVSWIGPTALCVALKTDYFRIRVDDEKSRAVSFLTGHGPASWRQLSATLWRSAPRTPRLCLSTRRAAGDASLRSVSQHRGVCCSLPLPIYCLHPRPLSAQIKVLIQRRDFELALRLHEIGQSDPDRADELRDIDVSLVEVATTPSTCSCQRQFAESLDLLELAEH